MRNSLDNIQVCTMLYLQEQTPWQGSRDNYRTWEVIGRQSGTQHVHMWWVKQGYPLEDEDSEHEATVSKAKQNAVGTVRGEQAPRGQSAATHQGGSLDVKGTMLSLSSLGISLTSIRGGWRLGHSSLTDRVLCLAWARSLASKTKQNRK